MLVQPPYAILQSNDTPAFAEGLNGIRLRSRPGSRLPRSCAPRH
jgi:hypothetical protein